MKKSLLEELTEEVELARQGKIHYEPDPPYIEIDDPVEFEKGVAEMYWLNGMPVKEAKIRAAEAMKNPGLRIVSKESTVSKSRDSSLTASAPSGKSMTEKTVEFQISKAGYARLVSKAKREKVTVGNYVRKLVENR